MQDQILKYGIYATTMPNEIAQWIHAHGGEYNALKIALSTIEQLKSDNKHIIGLCEEVLLLLEQSVGNAHALKDGDK